MNRRFESWRSCVGPALPLVAGIVLGAIGRATADDAAGSRAELRGLAAAEAAQLGDPSFAVRERATRNLIEFGVGARPVLLALRENPDAEVRAHVRKILTIVGEADFRVRLEAFAADADGKQQLDLPSWDRFRREIGDSREARAIFVAMQQTEGNLLAALADDPKTVSARFSERFQAAQLSLHVQNETGAFVTAGSVATLLFVGAADEVRVDEQDAMQMENIVHYPVFEELLRSSATSPVCRRLLGRWVARGASSIRAMQNILLAFSYDLKEGADLARRLLAKEGEPPDVLPFALLAVGRFGTVADRQLIEPLFADSRLCVRRRMGAASEVQVQIRDVALAVALHLTNQDLKTYGFAHAQSNPQMLFVLTSLSFGDDTARSAAFKKWGEWQAAQSAEPEK